MFARTIIAPLGLLGLFALSGCGPGKLDETKNWTLDPSTTPAQAIILDPQPKPQTITVEFESSASDVDVGAFKDADAKDLDTVQFSKALKAEKGKKGSFIADVPENTGIRVVVSSPAKKTDVKLHVTNRK